MDVELRIADATDFAPDSTVSLTPGSKKLGCKSMGTKSSEIEDGEI